MNHPLNIRKDRNSKFRSFYLLGDLNEDEILDKEFELSCRRTVTERIHRGLIKTYKPVIDIKSFRVFQTMKDYNNWCERKLPKWLGYGKAK